MGFFYAYFKILRLPFPFFFCSPELTDELFRDTGNGSRFSAFTRNSSSVMKKENQRAHGRYVSVDKIQQMLIKLGAELCSGHKRAHVAKEGKTIFIYTNGGSVNITFNEEGGKK